MYYVTGVKVAVGPRFPAIRWMTFGLRRANMLG